MKNFLTLLFLIFAFNSYATIENLKDAVSTTTPTQIESNRACFKELEMNGCGKPDDDHTQFRSCLNNVHGSLTKSCQKLMTDLYK